MMFRNLLAQINRYERHLSAVAMVAGFAVDNVVFERVDLPTTQFVFLGYAATCFISISALHFIESRAEVGKPRPWFRTLFPIATQFALGGFWSGFLIFYARSAVISVSWPYLLLLVAIFIGNELFHRYHDRLVLTTVLFFFALYSFFIFTVPVYTHTLGAKTFLLSGALAIGVFLLFVRLLRFIGRERFLSDVWRIRFGAFTVLLLVNIFYFTHILPPLPLTLSAGGIYHDVTRTAGTYVAQAEKQSWLVSLGAPATLHVFSGQPIYAYSAVFAPTQFTTTVVHRWEWYSPRLSTWITQSTISFPLTGGRDGGYRGYSYKTNLLAGDWRVTVETTNSDVIGRMRFTVIPTEAPASTTVTVLE